MSLPNFLCIGAQKAGTTLLFDILKQSPDIYLPDRKELHFFDRDEDYAKGASWYEEQYFNGSGDRRCCGEITPSYIFFDAVPERICKTLGSETKFVVLLRNPADRAYSHYWMQFKRGIEPLPFMEAVHREPERMRDEAGKARFSYVGRGLYFKQIQRYLEYFPLANMKFIIFEELVRDIPGKTREVLEFLNCGTHGLDRLYTMDKVNSSRLEQEQYIRGESLNRGYVQKHRFGRRHDYPSLKPKYRRVLEEMFREDTKRLKSLLPDVPVGW